MGALHHQTMGTFLSTLPAETLCFLVSILTEGCQEAVKEVDLLLGALDHTEVVLLSQTQQLAILRAPQGCEKRTEKIGKSRPRSEEVQSLSLSLANMDSFPVPSLDSHCFGLGCFPGGVSGCDIIVALRGSVFWSASS